MKLTDQIIAAARQVDTIAGGMEAIVLALTSRAAAWIACVPTILLTARSCEVIFSLTPMEALASAVALELVGQSAVKTWLAAREWNRTKRESDAPANARLALVLTVGYFAIDFVLIAILQVPKARVEPIYYAALLFPLAQIISTVTTAERAAQFGREAVAEEKAAKRRAVRAERKPAQRKKVPVPAISASGNDTAERAAAILAIRPDISGSELGRQLGKSERMGRVLKAELAPVISGNGGNQDG